ncbi:MAG: hypothetical protein Q7S33_00690 [Nanoarchaeota archaeon]|nr:hypothetical protein [Nanoarchaeota archaeon]
MKQTLKNILNGMAHILDLGTTIQIYPPEIDFYFNNSLSPEQKDAIAISKDWGMVGKDLEYAIGKYKLE